MTPGRGAFIAAVNIAASAFTAAGCLAHEWAAAPLPFLVAGVWLLCLRQPRPRLSGACFTVMICGAAGGLLAGLSAPLLLGVSLAAVAAWDLEAVVRASRGAADPAAARHAVLAHVVRLVPVLGAGALLGAAALFLRLSLGFGPVLGIAALLAISLAALLRSLAKTEQERSRQTDR